MALWGCKPEPQKIPPSRFWPRRSPASGNFLFFDVWQARSGVMKHAWMLMAAFHLSVYDLKYGKFLQAELVGEVCSGPDGIFWGSGLHPQHALDGQLAEGRGLLLADAVLASHALQSEPDGVGLARIV